MPDGIAILGELYSTKNSTRIRKGPKVTTRDQFGLLVEKRKQWVSKSGVSAGAEEGLLLQLQANRGQWQEMAAGHHFPLRVRFKLYRRSKGRFDYLNTVQGLCDLMTKAGYYPDDNANFLIPDFGDGYEVDPQNPRTIITII